MSYEKITELIEGNSVDVIRFYYETDSVFDEISETTSYKAASIIKGKDGQPNFDQIQVSSDDKSFIKKRLKEAMLEVFAIMFKIIGSTNIEHDTSVSLSGGESVTASYALIKDNGRYRTINLDFIDQLIYNALVDYILYKWYVLRGLGPDAEISFGEFKNGLARISEKTLALRQPSA